MLRLNADDGLNKLQRVLWFGSNWLNNHYRPNKSSDMTRIQYRPFVDASDFVDEEIKYSPSRMMSKMFLDQFDWGAVRSELQNINVFDAGCGRGVLAGRIDTLTGGISSYHGIDIVEQPEWSDAKSSELPVTFSKGDVANVGEYMPDDANLFVTQSALEHFPDDVGFFAQIQKYLTVSENNVIQIHLFPSRACLRLYGFHGLRQYSPRTVSKITKMFAGDNSYSVLYDLGGRNSNDLHYEFISRPIRSSGVDRRETETTKYHERLIDAINKDSSETCADPSWHALVIHSNFKERRFAPPTAI